MRYYFLFLTLTGIFQNLNAQLRTDSKAPTTTTLPAGTSWQNGHIVVAAGYKATISPNDNKVVIISTVSSATAKPTSVSGTFTCVCSNTNKTNDCSVAVRETELFCVGEKCGSDCKLYTTIKPSAGFGITRATKGEIWRRFIPGVKQ